MRKNTNGFTLVELLIVIVVIAILASISVVAYSGIQERAQAVRATAVAEAYVKLLKMYKVEHGHYPSSDVPAAAPYYRLGCLGNPADFPAVGSYQAGECNVNANSNTSWSWRGLANETLMNELAPYGSVPDSSYNSISGASGSYSEAWRGVRYDPISPVNPSIVYVQWSLKGDRIKDCGPASSPSYSSYNPSIDVTMCSMYMD